MKEKVQKKQKSTNKTETKRPLKISKKPIQKKVVQKSPKPVELSIIIVSYNVKNLTKQTIESIIDNLHGVNYEIIVVDNASTDGSIEMLKKLKTITYLQNLRNQGFGAANDRGAKHAQGKYLLFLNPDTIVEDSSLVRMISFLKKSADEVGLVGPKILDAGPKRTIQYGSFGWFFSPWRLILRLTKKMPLLNQKQPYTLVDWVTGACFLISRELYRKLHGFDENFFCYFEDQDLCLRIKQLDLEVAVYHEAQIIHINGASSTSKTKTKLYDQAQNYFISKHYGYLWTSLLHLFRLPYRLLQR